MYLIDEVHIICYFSYSPHKEPIQRMVYLKNTNRYLAISKVRDATETTGLFYFIAGICGTARDLRGAGCVSMWHCKWFQLGIRGYMWSYVWFNVEL